MCVAYEVDGERVERMPYHQSDLHTATPIYEELPGWQSEIGDCRTLERAARGRRATTCCSSPSGAGVPVSYVGVGPERLQTVAL